MTEGFVLIFDLLTGGLRVSICLFFIHRLLSSKKPDKKCVLVGLSGSVIITVILFLFPVSDFFRIGMEAVWIAVCSGRFQKTDTRMRLFISVFYEIAVSLWIFLFSAGLGIAVGSETYLERSSPCGQVAVWIVHLLLTAIMIYIVKHPDMDGKAGFRLVTMIIVVGFIAVVSLSEQTVLVIADDTLTMWTILSVVLMMSAMVFNMKRQCEVEKEVARLKSEQAELLERDYNALNHAYAVNAKLFHDFHNHIGILRQMLSHQNYDGAVQYLDELQEPIREMTDTVWTGDETVDYLINSKAAAASACQIQMQAQVEFPHHTNIRSADLCAIIGNLLDNALEAACKIPDSRQRFISLTIRRIHQMLVIKVENSCVDEPRQESGQFKTTKSGQGLHGWGLKSAQTAAEKYDGTIQTTYAGTVFRAVATLSYHAVSTK